MAKISQTSPHNPASRLLHVLGRPECKLANAPLTPAGWTSNLTTKPDVLEFATGLRRAVDDLEQLWNKLPESKQRLTSGVVPSLRQALDHTFGIAQVSGKSGVIGAYISPTTIYQLEVVEAEISEKFDLPDYAQQEIEQLRSEIEKCIAQAKDALIPPELRETVISGLRDVLRQLDLVWIAGPLSIKVAGDKVLGGALVVGVKGADSIDEPESKKKVQELFANLFKTVAGADKVAGFAVKLIRIGDFVQKLLPGFS